VKVNLSGCGTWILPALFIGIAIVSGGMGVSDVIKEHTFLTKAELDAGTITDYQVDSSGKTVEFCPIINFTTKSGEPQSYEGSDCARHPQDVIIGQHVQVWFDPQEPDRFQTFRGSVLAAYLDVSFPLFFSLLFLLIFGLIIGINLLQALGPRRRQAASSSYAPSYQPHMASAPLVSPAERDTDASLEAQAARLKAQTERLQAAEADLERKIEARRRQS